MLEVYLRGRGEQNVFPDSFIAYHLQVAIGTTFPPVIVNLLNFLVGIIAGMAILLIVAKRLSRKT